MNKPTKTNSQGTTPAETWPGQNPTEIARESFKLLASRRIAPTPDAYRAVYDEIAGTHSAVSALGPEEMLSRFASKLAATPGVGDVSSIGRRLSRAIESRDWEAYSVALVKILEVSAPADIKAGKPSAVPIPDAALEAQSRTLREILSRTLSMAVAALLSATPELAKEAETLGTLLKAPCTDAVLNDIGNRVKKLCYHVETRSGDNAEQHHLVLQLFNLLLDNVGVLLDDDSWLRGQIDIVKSLMAGPIDPGSLEEATRSFKEIIYKQSHLKHSLSDVKEKVTNMMGTVIDRLGHVADSTADYHDKMSGYSNQIRQASHIGELSMVVDAVLRDTRLAQEDAMRAREKVLSSRQDVQDAEVRIQTLEEKLQHLSELVREDQLTGSLNRRGLDDAFERESARSDRRGLPLCVALLDLDNFKRLNDTYGHSTGDAALKHLVKIVKDTLRSMDAIARFGGEEFLILFPETTVQDAASTMTRLQRELTKHYFMHENEKLLITFSAGVALREPKEDQASVVHRADLAMYQAKTTGKNRVVIAEPASTPMVAP